MQPKSSPAVSASHSPCSIVYWPRVAPVSQIAALYSVRATPMPEPPRAARRSRIARTSRGICCGPARLMPAEFELEIQPP